MCAHEAGDVFVAVEVQRDGARSEQEAVVEADRVRVALLRAGVRGWVPERLLAALEALLEEDAKDAGGRVDGADELLLELRALDVRDAQRVEDGAVILARLLLDVGDDCEAAHAGDEQDHRVDGPAAQLACGRVAPLSHLIAMVAITTARIARPIPSVSEKSATTIGVPMRSQIPSAERVVWRTDWIMVAVYPL